MRLGALIRERVIDPVRQAQGTPASLARGAALGMWVALTPTVGVQMAIVGILAIPLRANIPVGLALVWISNPLTLLPLYFAYYWLGALIVAQPSLGFEDVAERLGQVHSHLLEEGLLGALGKLGEDLGEAVFWPMIVGSFIMATAVSVPTYHLVLLWAQRRATRRQIERIHLDNPGAEAVQGEPGEVRSPAPSDASPVDSAPADSVEVP